MQFEDFELAAVLKAAFCLANADGKMEQEEMNVFAGEMAAFGVDEQIYQMLRDEANAMTSATMIDTLSALDESRKKYVCGFLAGIMVSDGDIDDSEEKLWQLTSTLAGFPKMSITEAATYWATH